MNIPRSIIHVPKPSTIHMNISRSILYPFSENKHNTHEYSSFYNPCAEDKHNTHEQTSFYNQRAMHARAACSDSHKCCLRGVSVTKTNHRFFSLRKNAKLKSPLLFTFEVFVLNHRCNALIPKGIRI